MKSWNQFRDKIIQGSDLDCQQKDHSIHSKILGMFQIDMQEPSGLQNTPRKNDVGGRGLGLRAIQIAQPKCRNPLHHLVHQERHRPARSTMLILNKTPTLNK